MWFVVHYVRDYYPTTLDEFNNEQGVIDFLNANTGHSDFRFTVIEGQKVEFEPVKVALQYCRKR